MESLPLVQGTMVGDVFEPISAKDEPLLSHRVFKFTCIEFSKAPFL